MDLILSSNTKRLLKKGSSLPFMSALRHQYPDINSYQVYKKASLDINRQIDATSWCIKR